MVVDTHAFTDVRASIDAIAVELDAVVAVDVFDEDVSVLLDQPGVLAGDVPLGQTDRIALLPADRDLVPDEGNDGGLALVVLDDELVHALEARHRRPRRPVKSIFSSNTSVKRGPGQLAAFCCCFVGDVGWLKMRHAFM